MGFTKLGILGGSFDPVHRGHILLAQAALESAGLDAVLLVVAKAPPHKTPCASAFHRLQMVRLACERFPGLWACDLELGLSGKSYAIDTVLALKQQYPRAKLFYLLGSDTLLTLPHWYRGSEILALAEPLCFLRRGPLAADAEQVRRFQERQHLPVGLLDVQLPAVSSTEIRCRLQEGLPVSSYVPPQVEHYIRENGLYL